MRQAIPLRALTTQGYAVAGVPSVAVDIADGSLNIATATSTITFTFSEAPVGFTASDITAANGTVSGLAATANPLVWTATFTATAGFEGTGSVSVNVGSYSNAAGNLGSGATDTVLIDTQAPLPTIALDADITADDIINVAEASQTIPVTGVVGGDAKVGDTVTLTVNGKTFTGTVAADKTFSIGVPGADLAADADHTVDASITTADAAGNTATSSDTESYSVAGGVPSVTVDVVDTHLNAADASSTVTFTFSEAPVGFTASDITAANGTVTGLTATANPLVYTATFTATAGFEGTGSVSVAIGSYSNTAGNPGSGATDTVAIDTQAPAPTITLDANITSDDVINIAEAGQTIPVTGVVGGDAQVGDTVTLTVNGKTFTGTVAGNKTFSIDVPGADLAADADYTVDASITTTDAAGNTASSTDSEGYSVAGVPSVTVDIVGSSLNSADALSSVTFTFSETPTGFTASDITAANGTVTGLTVTANPLVYTATFTANAGFEGTGSVSVNVGSYSNAAGNPGSGSTRHRHHRHQAARTDDHAGCRHHV